MLIEMMAVTDLAWHMRIYVWTRPWHFEWQIGKLSGYLVLVNNANNTIAVYVSD
jgi:hypothetical protein